MVADIRAPQGRSYDSAEDSRIFNTNEFPSPRKEGQYINGLFIKVMEGGKGHGVEVDRNILVMLKYQEFGPWTKMARDFTHYVSFLQ